ncbi:hypothetical protein V6S67_18055 [Arthrobacter sp. Soc17.1.1.1]|uniref:hypothetical protein n=1 Tax=Arthrobacter sp. Soc17.1.1.1 TaxID=3121277 RepID=UPI002FE4EB18
MTFRDNLSAALEAHIDPALDVAAQLSTRITQGGYPVGSWAAKMAQGDAVYKGKAVGAAPATQALAGIPWSLASGIDHLTALAASVKSSQTLGYSLSTIVRGSVEAYGRAHFLLENTDVDRLIRRWMATRLSSLKWAIKSAEDGADKARLQQLRDSLKGDATAFGFTPADLQLSFTALAVDVYNHVYGEDDGSLEYSRLSAVAHAENSGIHSLVVREQAHIAPGLHASRIEASDELLAEIAWGAFSVHSKIMTDAMQKFGEDPNEHREFGTSLIAVGSVLAEA